MTVTASINAAFTNNGQTESVCGHAPQLARRALFAGAAFLAGAPIAAAAASSNPDAELIERCHRFAEEEIGCWYQCAVTLRDAPLAARELQKAQARWIEATAASTPDGWRAKALAMSAWEMDAYDFEDGDAPDAVRSLQASMLRDMAGPARAAILKRLVERFGPLPGRKVTADGRWLEILA